MLEESTDWHKLRITMPLLPLIATAYPGGPWGIVFGFAAIGVCVISMVCLIATFFITRGWRQKSKRLSAGLAGTLARLSTRAGLVCYGLFLLFIAIDNGIQGLGFRHSMQRLINDWQIGVGVVVLWLLARGNLDRPKREEEATTPSSERTD
jgi:hypothetical protein